MESGCGGHWTCVCGGGRGVSPEGRLCGERSYGELANKLASDGEGGGGGGGVGRGGDSFSQA